jgi:hypothetical protein
MLLQVSSGMKEVRDRIASVKNTSKITEVSRRGGRAASWGTRRVAPLRRAAS